MDSDNFTIQQEIEFLSNKGNFNEQPLFVLMEDNAVTGGKYITVYRQRKSRDEGASGTLVLEIGNENGVTSVTGSDNIKAEGLKNGLSAAYPVFGTTASHDAGVTASSVQYTINTVMRSSTELSTVVYDGDVIFGNMTITASDFNYNDLDYVGVGYRPFNGEPHRESATSYSSTLTGGQVALYLFNRNEGASDRGSIWNEGTINVENSKTIYDRGGYETNMVICGSLSSNTITGSLYSPQPSMFANNNNPGGWSTGPIEGAFRFNGGTMAESVPSQFFNPIHRPTDQASAGAVRATSALTLMSWINVSQTSASASLIASIGTSADPSGALDNSLLKISQTAASALVVVGATAASLSTALFVQNIGGENRGNLGEWHHLAVTVQSEAALDRNDVAITRPNSGTHVFINGWEVASAATTAGLLTFNGTNMERPVLRLGGVFKETGDLDTVVSGLTGAIGMTRLFNRALSGTEIRQNYVSSLPGMMRLDKLAIA